jgi:CRISPR type III-A-associated RAMP protein Csm4
VVTLIRFLEFYSIEEPPLIVSNAFPKGYLPRPILPPIEKKRAMKLIERFWGPNEMVIGLSALKTLSKMNYFSKDLVKTLAGKEISNHLVIGTILGDPKICPMISDYLASPCPQKYDTNGNIGCNFISPSKKDCPIDLRTKTQRLKVHQSVMYHSKISRFSGSALEGGLFATEETFYNTDEFELYCKIGNNFSEAKLKQCLEFITIDGYGGKKSTGKGNIVCTVETGGPDIPTVETNAFMTLSNYLPRSGDPEKGYYRMFTKYGKLGGHFANSPFSVGENPMPFKYPLAMFGAGSVFLAAEENPYYGRMAYQIHAVATPKITHYGIAYPVPLKIEVQHD